MCLHTRRKTGILVEKAIICYKTMYGRANSRTLRSAVQNFQYKIGSKYSTEARVTKSFGSGYDGYQGFHSFTKLRYAKRSQMNISKRKIVVCKIPKGALLWLGSDGSDQLSNKIKIVKVYESRPKKSNTAKSKGRVAKKKV